MRRVWDFATRNVATAAQSEVRRQNDRQGQIPRPASYARVHFLLLLLHGCLLWCTVCVMLIEHRAGNTKTIGLTIIIIILYRSYLTIITDRISRPLVTYVCRAIRTNSN